MTQARPPLSAHLALGGAQIGFGLFPVAGKLLFDRTGAHGIPPLGVAALRVFFGSVTLMAFAQAMRTPHVARADLPRLALYALFGIIANQLLFLEGLAHSSATHAGVLVAASPAVAYALAILLGREKLQGRPAAGVAVAMAGAAWIVLGRPADPNATPTLFGDGLLIANVTSYAIYLVLVKDVLRHADPLRTIAWVFTFGALANGPIGIPALLRTDWAALTAQHWAALAFVLLFPTSICYALNAYALRRAPATLAAVYTCTQPIVATVSAALVLHERPALPETVYAAVLILAGVSLVAFRDPTPPETATSRASEPPSRTSP